MAACVWIIPARAGFTPRRRPRAPRRPDHPRSRGVYVEQTDAVETDPGSSPLARGLLPMIRNLQTNGGIIPARAGFTQYGPGGRTEPEDHPRSRGVYAIMGMDDETLMGSSPLARGLLIIPAPRRVRQWIIPARAGFTPSGMVLIFATRDHPRSRGVYRPGRSRVRRSWGSSPLARGLPWPRSEILRPGRIIPARAGFTAPLRSRRRGRGDHPRSRGVYRFTVNAPRTGAGSSPLARGLLALRI